MKTRSVFKVAVALVFVAVLMTPIQSSCQPCCVSAKVLPEATALSDSALTVAPAVGTGENFSIIWITDTQYLAERYPTYFDSLCRWIVNNVDKYNVQMVIHTGDIVETEGNQTQWVDANSSISRFLDAGIPYCWDAGNHDYNQTCWIGNQYAAFNPAALQAKPYWIGSYGDGISTAVHFTASDMDFLIVNLAFNADDAALTWTNNLLDTHPESHAIVATHFYVNRTSGYESWAMNLRRTVLATHESVFLTLSGHVYPLVHSGIRTQVGDRHELVFNRQEKDNELGSASLRILTFDTVHNVIDVKTFLLYANTFMTDEDNQFTLSTNFWNAAAVNENTEIPEFPSVIAAVILLTLCTAATVFWRKTRGATATPLSKVS
ncbi:MAG: metallophosphoesterase [Candidatus Bathyarchaeota archaeon]|nr:metallophosphoesterase [Candidatus Bathyarchaeota archaeon]